MKHRGRPGCVVVAGSESETSREPLAVKKPEAAWKLGVSVRSLERLIAARELQVIRGPGGVRVTFASIRAYVVRKTECV